jgi:hypothetical protein
MEKSEISLPVEQGYLESLLQQILSAPDAHIQEWGAQKITGGFEFGSAIYHLQGFVEVDGKEQAWSLILKVIQPDVQFDDPQGFRYWKREVQAYQSGMLQELPGTVIAPRCYDIVENTDGSVWIWLEDIKSDWPQPWSIEQYAQVANHLGQFNGAYLVGQPFADQAWISHDWLRKYLEHAAPMVEFIRQNPTHPLVQSLLPGISLPMTLAFWEETPRMLKILDELPEAFCHQDAFGRNLFYRGRQVIAIDWGYAGIAPLGAELAPLIGCFGLAGFPSSQAKDLEQACLAGYLKGLHQAGSNPDPRQVRLGYILTVFFRYALGATVGELLPGLLDKHIGARVAEGLGTTQEKAAEIDPGISAYYQSVGIEALKLCGLGTMARFMGRTAANMVRIRWKHPAETSKAA